MSGLEGGINPNSGDSCHLSLIIDADLSWLNRNSDPSLSKSVNLSINEFLDCFYVFLNSFLLLNRSNSISIYCYTDQFRPIFPLNNQATDLSKLVVFSRQIVPIQKLIQKSINEIISQSSKMPVVTKTSSLTKCLSLSSCFLSRIRNEYPTMSLRYLIFSIHNISNENYISFMNSVFAAKTLGPIDVCMLTSTVSPYLQQAANITNGLYYRVNQRNNLIQLLITVFLSQGETRELMVLPKNDSINLIQNVPCICHNRKLPNDIGYVCSVCLSIYCNKIEECRICGSRLSS